MKLLFALLPLAVLASPVEKPEDSKAAGDWTCESLKPFHSNMFCCSGYAATPKRETFYNCYKRDYRWCSDSWRTCCQRAVDINPGDEFDIPGLDDWKKPSVKNIGSGCVYV